jgi:hypothetical protein
MGASTVRWVNEPGTWEERFVSVDIPLISFVSLVDVKNAPLKGRKSLPCQIY